MSNYGHKHDDHDCKDHSDNPADQPKPPKGGEGCGKLPEPKPPNYKKPDPCLPNPKCYCPPGPGSDPNCLEILITKKAAVVAAAEKDKAFKAELEALLTKAKAAAQEYNKDTYDKLVKQWVEQDKEIADLIVTLVCALPCSYCVIECFVCPFINKMHDAEEALKWDPAKYPDAYNLYDLLNWHTRDKVVKERRVKRIADVLKAWEKPAQTIKKALDDDAKLIVDARSKVGTEPAKVAFDVFFKLIPMHLAIAPPAGGKWITKIDKKYTEFCYCDTGCPDDCCGPDVGLEEWSLRQRLLGPQAYLIDPNDYITLICCLVEKRYAPAQAQLNDAEAQVLTLETEIKRNKDLVENGLKAFFTDARAAIPTVINCCDFENEQKS